MENLELYKKSLINAISTSSIWSTTSIKAFIISIIVWKLCRLNNRSDLKTIDWRILDWKWCDLPLFRDWSTNLENFILIASILGETGRWTIRLLDGSAYLNNGGLLSRTKAELCFPLVGDGCRSPPGKTMVTVSLLMDSFSGSCRLKIDRLHLN